MNVAQSDLFKVRNNLKQQMSIGKNLLSDLESSEPLTEILDKESIENISRVYKHEQAIVDAYKLQIIEQMHEPVDKQSTVISEISKMLNNVARINEDILSFTKQSKSHI